MTHPPTIIRRAAQFIDDDGDVWRITEAPSLNDPDYPGVQIEGDHITDDLWLGVDDARALAHAILDLLPPAHDADHSGGSPSALVGGRSGGAS